MNLTGKYFFLVLLLAGLFCLDTYAQTGSLTGKIIDVNTRETLPGATISIVGTYKGTAADIDGNYTISDIKPGDYSIKVNFIGYTEKIFNGIRIEKDQKKTLNVELTDHSVSMQTVEIVGDKNLVDLESGSSEIKISREEIKEMTVKNVQEIIENQAGVSKTPDGLQIRGGRVYETQFLVDGISAQDPLSGTGFGVEVSASSIGDIKLITGGAGAEYGDGSSGVIATNIREGGDKFFVSGSWQRDNLGFKKNEGSAWNTDIVDIGFGGPVPFTKKKASFFNGFNVNITDDYFNIRAKQLHTSLFTKNDSLWAPRQNNKFSHSFKVTYQIKPGTKISLTNQHSLAINQSTRSLQIVGFDAVVTPGLQYDFINSPDNANTYTHQSNLSVLAFNHVINERWVYNANAGYLFTNLRADANGRPFRSSTVDRIYDPESIVSDPVSVFNPQDSIVFVYPGPGLVNNGGIATLWHDHYAQELTIKNKFNYYSKTKHHNISFGQEHKELEYQWIDVTRPWVGAPIQINDSVRTPSISVGSSNDIWKVKPANGGVFFQDNISYKGIIATAGVRFNYWAQGKFADNAVNDSTALVQDEIRKQYLESSKNVLGRRFKARILPKIKVSFPVTDNNMLYFNYGHAMRLPHPRFIYAGLDPVYQDRSFLSRLGNPNLNPEVTVSYEVGLKSQITKDLGITVTAFNNDKYDYIVTRTIQLKDQTGRLVDKTFNINQDYAKVVGVELGVFQRVGKMLRINFNGSYQVATGKSNSAAESLLQIRQTGFVNTTKEQYLAWDRPLDLKASVIFLPDTSIKIGNFSFKGFSLYVSSTYKSGLRYTPYELVGYNDSGRPMYERIDDQPFQKIGRYWFWTDFKLTRNFRFTKTSGLALSIEVRNAFNNKNSQIINPVTGRAYEEGDPVPSEWRDPKYPDPQDNGQPPSNPARFMEPRHILYGISFQF